MPNYFIGQSGDWFNIWNPNATNSGYGGFIQPRGAMGNWYLNAQWANGSVFHPDHCSPVMSLLIRYAHIPFYFRFSFAFPTLLIYHYAPPLWRNRTTIALTPSDQSCLFDGHMTYDSHVFTSILSVSNIPPPAVRPITSSHTVWSGTFYNFALCSHSCLPFVFYLPVFTFR